jgi:hypothetical protein
VLAPEEARFVIESRTLESAKCVNHMLTTSSRGCATDDICHSPAFAKHPDLRKEMGDQLGMADCELIYGHLLKQTGCPRVQKHEDMEGLTQSVCFFGKSNAPASISKPQKYEKTPHKRHVSSQAVENRSGSVTTGQRIVRGNPSSAAGYADCKGEQPSWSWEGASSRSLRV